MNDHEINALEEKYAPQIRAAAVRGIGTDTTDGELARERAYDLVFNLLIGDEDWEAVPATSVSDIAYEAAERAWTTRSC